MEFGFGFLILFGVIFYGVGRLCGWGRRGCKPCHRGRVDSTESDSDRRLSNLESRVKRLGDRAAARDRLVTPATFRGGKDKEAEPVRMKAKRKSALEELQQKFVEGRLSLSEYEQELDRLERIE
jgi:hypothetical protein